MTTEMTMTTETDSDFELNPPNAPTPTMSDDADFELDPETDDEWTNCDECLESVTCDDYGANDGLCAACLAKTFVCEECEERTQKTDAHKTHGTLCEGCGDSKEEEIAQERLDAAKDSARETLEAILDLDDLAAALKALAALKKITPKS
jgi:hypothetical protein